MSHTIATKYLSRLAAVLLVLAMLVCAMPAAFAAEVTEPAETNPPASSGVSGTCGANLSWTLDNGTLTITGSGAMANYTIESPAPWYGMRNQIYQLVLGEGLTTVGNLAFYECSKIRIAQIPDSVTRIGEFAFAHCKELAMLRLGSAVSSIEECAFSDCYALPNLQLPESLRVLGKKAFYRCESLTSVVVPAGVTEIGASAFGNCKSLVSADIQAQVTQIPNLMFYGCQSLVSVQLPDSVNTLGYHSFLECETLYTVYYNGSSQTPEQIQEAIGLDIPDFTDRGSVTEGDGGNTSASTQVTENELGGTVITNTEVIRGEDTTVSIENQHIPDAGQLTTDITVTITGEGGWQEAGDAVSGALNDVENIGSGSGINTATPEITIYVNDDGSVGQNFIDSLVDRDVIVTIITPDGSTWKINTSEMESGSGAYDLRYEISLGDDTLCQELEVNTSFFLRFKSAAQINAQVMIRIGEQYSMQNATLYQRQDGELLRRQTTVVDKEGFAHFYLASVDDACDYYIAMNLVDAESDAIVPEELNSEFGSPVNVQPLQYEITGRTSSWGMTFNQVTWIMIAFLGTTVIVVGVVMYSLNKRRLRMGYVPELDDEYED